MPAEKMSATEAWVRLHAPELLQGPSAEIVAPFIKADDLNGLGHFLGRQVELDQLDQQDEQANSTQTDKRNQAQAAATDLAQPRTPALSQEQLAQTRQETGKRLDDQQHELDRENAQSQQQRQPKDSKPER